MTFFNSIFKSIGIVNFVNNYYIVQKLDHLTCSKFLMLTPLYKPNNFIPVYSQNCVTCEVVAK